ncbi:hypothetical protein J7I91_16250 [Pseudomonas sp. ISL-84]|nr:hypothetical protein [Pseudomonas sp. ISL-84]
MKVRHLKIGEHILIVEVNSDSILEVIHNKFIVVIDSKPNLTVKINKGFGTPFQNYNVQITKDPNKIYFRRADYLIEATHDYREATISVHDELALKHALMNLYSSFIGYHKWGLLIHSSCAIENRKAHIFSGQSGAGKSTAAKLSAPRELLSDEATILKIDDGKVTVFDSPFRSELEATGTNETASLASIQLLHQALHNKRTQLKKSDALIHLMDKVFYWAHNPEETKQILKLLNKLVETVPVYDLHFQKNNQFWELIS